MPRSRLRTLLVSLLWLALSADGQACSCFPPEVRAKTAEDALGVARWAVYARVLDIDANGRARLLVLESFKGPARGAVVGVDAGSAQCDTPSFTLGEETLLLSFAEPTTACDKQPPEHYLLEAFRAHAAKARPLPP